MRGKKIGAAKRARGKTIFLTRQVYKISCSLVLRLAKRVQSQQGKHHYEARTGHSNTRRNGGQKENQGVSDACSERKTFFLEYFE